MFRVLQLPVEAREASLANSEEGLSGLMASGSGSNLSGGGWPVPDGAVVSLELPPPVSSPVASTAATKAGSAWPEDTRAWCLSREAWPVLLMVHTVAYAQVPKESLYSEVFVRCGHACACSHGVWDSPACGALGSTVCRASPACIFKKIFPVPSKACLLTQTQDHSWAANSNSRSDEHP